jgi:periplasmic divalent cation tolerance protein
MVTASTPPARPLKRTGHAQTGAPNDTAPNDTGTDTGAALVYTTWPDLASAELAASVLLDAKVAACLNIWPGMISHYTWEGRRERASEVVMLIKTRASLTGACIALVRRQHPYSNPAAIVIPVTGGASAFLDWIADATIAPTR